MRTLIIGTSGQLATELYRQSDGIQLAPPRKVDVADEGAVHALLDAVRPGLVVNASAYTAVDRAEEDRARAFAVNSSGPRYLARWCAANGAALIHVSTDYVFDGSKPSAYVEDDAVGPINVYGQSKLAGEVAIREELAQHLIVRTSWVFSAYGQNFVKTMRRLGAERDELRIIADQHGRPTSAADLAGAVWRVARERLLGDAPVAWGTYHLANADPTTWHAFAETIFELEARSAGRRPVVTPIPSSSYPTPAARPLNSVLDTSRFEATFGFGLRPFRLALRDVMDELQAS